MNFRPISNIKDLKFGWAHVIIIFISLITFQLVVANLQRDTFSEIVATTMDWAKQNSAEEIGNLTATAIELLLEGEPVPDSAARIVWENDLIHSLNSILRQPLMNRTVEAMCVILPYKNSFVALDLGKSVFDYFFNKKIDVKLADLNHEAAIEKYKKLHLQMVKSELTTSIQEGNQIIHVFVPLIPDGEYSGVVYLKVQPDVSFIGTQLLSSFNQTVLIFSSLIILGFLGMFYISTYTIKERDDTREELYKEREEHLADQINQQKEYHFTKRIYHTHHKAEKVMGFINEDVEVADETNIKSVKYRIGKYANFISRIIYDMKWFNPPIQTIRGPLFNIDVNEIIRFLIDNIFLRLSFPVDTIKFNLDLDNNIPNVHVNEFVAWEVFEPLIQNAIDHATREQMIITISTQFVEDSNTTIVKIADNGKGIPEEFLKTGEDGIKKIFLENTSTKDEEKQCGYGCYLAYEISSRCGWELDANNKKDGGACFILTIKN